MEFGEQLDYAMRKMSGYIGPSIEQVRSRIKSDGRHFEQMKMSCYSTFLPSKFKSTEASWPNNFRMTYSDCMSNSMLVTSKAQFPQIFHLKCHFYLKPPPENKLLLL